MVQVGGWISPLTFNLAVGVAAKAILLDKVSKEIANKLFLNYILHERYKTILKRLFITSHIV